MIQVQTALLKTKLRSDFTSGRVDRASATETEDTGSLPGQVKPKAINIGIHSFPALRAAIKGTV